MTYMLGQRLDSNRALLKRLVDGTETRRYYYTPEQVEREIARDEAKLAEQHAIVISCDNESRPYEDEFARRGGWTRAWLVDNAGGHVHRSMACSTCFVTTRFGWLPQVSGMDEDEIVALAGEGACTVCYPSAPAEVLNNPLALELPHRRAERLEREAEREAKRAAKAAKSLSIDGSVVEVRWTYGDLRRGWKDIKTYRAAELFVIECLSHSCVPSYDVAPVETVNEVLDMMAAKKGQPVAEIREALQAKAIAKRAKRAW
jgi:hypothetical protein